MFGFGSLLRPLWVGLPEVGTCSHGAGSSSVVQPQQPFRELGLPGLLCGKVEVPDLPAGPIQDVQRTGAPPPHPRLFRSFALISSSPRGKQRPNLRAGKGQWSAPSLLLGWHASRQGCAFVLLLLTRVKGACPDSSSCSHRHW